MFIKCSECDKTLAINDLKYYTADKQHAFCDAYCSNAWYDKTFKKLDAKKDQSNGNEWRRVNVNDRTIN